MTGLTGLNHPTLALPFVRGGDGGKAIDEKA